MATGDFDALKCPLPDCAGDLWLHWELANGLFVADTKAAPPTPADAEQGTWEVRCENGHVVLVPAAAECPDGCNEPADCDHDLTDEQRTFRFADIQRLVALIQRMSGGDAR